jgi:N-acetylated-alpha-linked acidic dipeptidase
MRLVLGLFLAASSLSAQQVGFSPSAAAREDSIERALIASPDTQSARLWTKALSRVPHLAGTSQQAVTRDYVLNLMKSWGLETSFTTYEVFLPQPDTSGLWLIPNTGAAPQPLSLVEPAVAGDSTSSGPQVLAFNGTAASGDVTGDAVYVGFGLIEDYKTLDSLGISVKGKIVIARYGRSYRGIKAREAERHGALGLILYSDPAEDGYVRGDVYPKGPMRPEGGYQRGSVLNPDGDPTTPGYASLPGARRVPFDSLDVPHIPVVPIGYGNAERILSLLGGPSVPQSWQGGLAFRYHVGPGPAQVHLVLRVEQGAHAMHPIWDTFGMIRGTTYPDQWIVMGAHRDAWGPGADDNITGTTTVLATARAFAELAKKGIRPARTIIFATWDAEEWGDVGSTEWVEQMADSLQLHAVAYINEDAMATGTNFGGAGSPSLKPLIRASTRVVPALTGPGTLYDTWLTAHHSDTTALDLGNMGGGSDFAGFYHHLGIPAGEIGFGGPAGVYHSMYDDYEWMTAFGDPQYRAHRTAAQLDAVIVSRLANATVAPFDYAAFGTEMRDLVSELDTGIARKGWMVSTEAVKAALERFIATARAFAAARDSGLSRNLSTSKTAAVTRALMQVERRLTRPQGLTYAGSWFKSLQFASDVDNGYATLAFPTVAEAIRYGDATVTAREIGDLASRIDAARSALDDARAALR